MQRLGNPSTDKQKTDGGNKHTTENYHYWVIGKKGDFQTDERAGPEGDCQQQGKRREAGDSATGWISHKKRRRQ
jgi:hypothetical protein